jgi:hypothetical protein
VSISREKVFPKEQIMYSQRQALLRLLIAVLTLALALGTPAFAQSKDEKKTTQKQEQPATKVDLNTASEKDLDSLPGVGPATAKKIISNRPYGSVDELKKAGLSQSTIDKIRPMVTVSGATASAPTAVTGPSPQPGTPSASPNTSTKQSSNLPQSDNTSATPAPGSGMVWVNLDTKVYHYEGDQWYGKTKHGKYMTEADAQKAGYRAAKNSKKKGE